MNQPRSIHPLIKCACEETGDICKCPVNAAGKKFDDGKTQYHLMPVNALEQVNRVLMHGAKKYGDGNWRNVENAEQRYYNAAMRHMQAWLNGEDTDNESNLPHLAHAACSLMFMIEKAAEKNT
jgi:hypothetical protein